MTAISITSILLVLIIVSVAWAWTAKDAPNLARVGNGIIIDAGSHGSRLHVYEWEPRQTEQLPVPLTLPSSSNQWTQRLSPGISTFSDHVEDIADAMLSLMDFAKEILSDYQLEWHSIPIFWRATGGMRELPREPRERILAEVKRFLISDACPFYFEDEYARILSGEEEAVFGWTAVNFFKDTLKLTGQGYGTSLPQFSYGALDMGGASTQISFFSPEQDIMANLFKLQLGGNKHYNLYAHSFLYFGSTSSRIRMKTRLAGGRPARHLQQRQFRESQNRRLSDTIYDPTEVLKTDDIVSELLNGTISESIVVQDYCIPLGYNGSYFVDSSSGKEVLVEVQPAADPDMSTFELCYETVVPLLNMEYNGWCQFAHKGECSFAGIYQPSLPTGNHSNFYAFSGYYSAWTYTGLPMTTTLADFKERTEYLCSLDYDQLLQWNRDNNNIMGKNVGSGLHLLCFQLTYTYTLLVDGYRFSPDAIISFVDQIDGFKIGWALGAMLYEINALPWEYIGKGAKMAYRDFDTYFKRNYGYKTDRSNKSGEPKTVHKKLSRTVLPKKLSRLIAITGGSQGQGIASRDLIDGVGLLALIAACVMIVKLKRREVVVREGETTGLLAKRVSSRTSKPIQTPSTMTSSSLSSSSLLSSSITSSSYNGV